MDGSVSYDYYMSMLATRDQALMIIGALVLVGALWWHLLADRPGIRRAVSWCLVGFWWATLALAWVVEVKP